MTPAGSPDMFEVRDDYTIASGDTTYDFTANAKLAGTHAIVTGPSMDNSGDQVRVVWVEEETGATFASAWADTSDTGSWTAGIIIPSPPWSIKEDDTLRVEIDPSQASDISGVVKVRGV